MKRVSSLLLLGAVFAFAGCGGRNARGTGGGDETPGDMAKPWTWEEPDLAGEPQPDLFDENNNMPDPCGDVPADPNCYSTSFGPPGGQFPLQSDPMKDPLAKDNGVNRDLNGWLKLDSTHTIFNYLWIANYTDLAGAGSASKIDSKTIREVARYRTVTCYSLKTGSTQQCDGTNGCCSIDDWNRYNARKNKMPEPGHQQVQMGNNAPSRTSVDFNGDLFIANRAFGGQSSVTKIANDISQCVDRNKNGRIDTSADTNGNGFIETDCNGDGQADNFAGLQGKPCMNGLKPEFYGEDDECILWTSNTFGANAVGRPLGLGSGDSGASDAWAGAFNGGQFVRIDGITGKDKADTPAIGNSPYGLAVDASGIAWATPLGGGSLCYFDAKKPSMVGCARGQAVGYGITLDRDQNVWVGSGVARYTPDRSNGWNNLGQGWWTRAGNLSGIGIAADSRNANDYFVYSCSGGTVTQIPASSPAWKPLKMDQTIQNPGWPTIQMPCRGVGVDSDQNVWGISMGMSTRALLDKNGGITQPKVNQAPLGMNKCPAGDQCPNMQAYTYSDFTGFGLRNFTRPTGTYQMLVKGCTDGVGGPPIDTQWFTINWDADVPPNTSLSVHAKAAQLEQPRRPVVDRQAVDAGLPAVAGPAPGHADSQPDARRSERGGGRQLADGRVRVQDPGAEQLAQAEVVQRRLQVRDAAWLT